MKLFAIASVFALSSILVSGSTIHLHRRGAPSICGEGSELLDETSVSHGGKTILVSTSNCRPTKRDTTVSKRSAINIDKRQNICTDGARTLACVTSTTAATTVADCTTLIDYIASYAPGNFTLVSYTICYETIAYDATLAANTCFRKTAVATCAGTRAAGDNYEVIVASVSS
ncbi:hypothetical protein BC826DRAFT_1106666 [Russula brevipes]|nr:hypothetical protein BC826DRAFT_1106666 [Russula brevipes]